MAAGGETGGIHRIVVGMDGSETSRAALRWAADEAAHHDAGLQVIFAWETPTVAVGIGYAPSGPPKPPEVIEDEATRMLTQTVDDVLGTDRPANVSQRIVQGGAAAVLLDAARAADLLVVGSRGLGGFAGLLLGSVSAKLAHHSSCPVVILRPAEPADEG